MAKSTAAAVAAEQCGGLDMEEMEEEINLFIVRWFLQKQKQTLLLMILSPLFFFSLSFSLGYIFQTSHIRIISLSRLGQTEVEIENGLLDCLSLAHTRIAMLPQGTLM